MDYQRNQVPGKWQEWAWLVPSTYRLLAFAIATAQIFIFPAAHYSVVSPVILVPGVGVYTLLKVIHPSRWSRGGTISFSLLGADITICVFLVLSTGGLNSPFLLYTLTPVLTAALFLDDKVTFTVAGASVAYVIVGHLSNPFFTTRFLFPELSYFLIYIIAVCLAAVLPYLTNINLRQRLQSEDILQERQRLSREIHDGSAQTLSALRWQAQLLHRRLAEMGINLNEAAELVRLSEEARQDSRVFLEVLRNYTGDGNFLVHLREYLEHLRQETNIDFRLDIQTGALYLETPVQLELLRICQEALNNIRKHSRAHNVQVKLKRVDGHLEVSIADDGGGFNILSYYHGGGPPQGQGLAVMQERAESIGAKFRILSLPGRGTEIQIDVPVDSHPSWLLWANR